MRRVCPIVCILIKDKGEFLKAENDSQISESVFIVGIGQPISIEDTG